MVDLSKHLVKPGLYFISNPDGGPCTHFYRDPDEDWNELPKELPKKLLSKLPLVPGMLLSVLVLGAKWPPNPAMFRIRW